MSHNKLYFIDKDSKIFKRFLPFLEEINKVRNNGFRTIEELDSVKRLQLIKVQFDICGDSYTYLTEFLRRKEEIIVGQSYLKLNNNVDCCLEFLDTTKDNETLFIFGRDKFVGLANCLERNFYFHVIKAIKDNNLKGNSYLGYSY